VKCGESSLKIHGRLKEPLLLLVFVPETTRVSILVNKNIKQTTHLQYLIPLIHRIIVDCHLVRGLESIVATLVGSLVLADNLLMSALELLDFLYMSALEFLYFL